ncbi:MAG: cytochrome c556 [Halieaceae bacterium]|jgi:cytochrome c556
MSAMIKGEMPWDQQAFSGYADGLALATQLDVVRGFAPGTEGGKTKAKAKVWNDLEGFKKDWNESAQESAKLAQVAASGDKAAIVAQFKETGGTCKGCHDEFKSKEYLN